MPTEPATFFDPAKKFDDNVDHGPFLSNQSQNTPSIEKEPGYAFLGHQINSPFGNPSGPLPTSRHIIGAFKQGIDEEDNQLLPNPPPKSRLLRRQR